MKISLLILSLIVYLNSYAQKPFVPVGAEWNYGISFDNYPSFLQGHYGLKSVRDTIIGTDTFSNINNEYFITSSDSVDYYFFRKGISKKILFKTNCQIGDTVTIDAYFKTQTNSVSDTFIPVRVVIENIHPLTNNDLNTNDPTKVFEFSLIEENSVELPYPLITHGTYIERIGQSANFNHFIEFFSPPAATAVTTSLRCFSSSEYNYKSAGLTYPCNYLSLGINGVSTNTAISIKVSPTPAYIDVNFSFAKGSINHITIYDLKGKLIAEYKTSGKRHRESIDVSGIKPGLYQCIIETNAGKTAIPLSINKN